MATRSLKPDTPVSFGYKSAWYALRTVDIELVVAALGIKQIVESTWSEGIEAAYSDKVFVTPPLGDWILAAGLCLFYKGETPAASVQPMLTRLSKEFGEAQYFCTYRVAE